MKISNRILLAAAAFIAIGSIAYAAGTFGRNKAFRISDVIYDCKSVVNADPYYGHTDGAGGTCGAWSTLGTTGALVMTTSETITITGAHLGDACLYVPGVTVAATDTAQALVWDCKVTNVDVATLRVTNTGASKTPTTGRRGVMVLGHAR